MITRRVVRGLALLATAAALCCGAPRTRYDGNVDPYNGVLDNAFGVPANSSGQGALAPQFMPTTTTSSTRSNCNGNTSCYVPQTGYHEGQQISFFNAGQIRTISFGTVPTFPPAEICDAAGQNCQADCAPDGTNCAYPPSMATQAADGSCGFHADVFPHSCAPDPAFDPVNDAYPKSEQFPIANALPLNNAAVSSTVRPPLGIVEVHGVTGVAGATCNDLKYAVSISESKLGAKRSATPTGFEVWMVFDPIVPVLATLGPNAAQITTGTFWFNGLQVNYLNSTSIPLNARGNLLAMDGVLVATSNGFTATDPNQSKRVILPYQPGDPGYSPIVRLHTFVTSQPAGHYTAICPKGATCTDSGSKVYVKFTDAAPDAASAILIVASPL